VNWVKSHVSKQSRLAIDVEDHVSSIIGITDKYFQNNIVVSLNMDFIRHDYTRYCAVIGELGTLRWDGIEGSIMIRKEGSEQWELLYQHKDSRNYTYIEEVSHFFDCVTSNTKPIINGDDGLNVLKVIESMRKSSE